MCDHISDSSDIHPTFPGDILGPNQWPCLLILSQSVQIILH